MVGTIIANSCQNKLIVAPVIGVRFKGKRVRNLFRRPLIRPVHPLSRVEEMNVEPAAPRHGCSTSSHGDGLTVRDRIRKS